MVVGGRTRAWLRYSEQAIVLGRGGQMAVEGMMILIRKGAEDPNADEEQTYNKKALQMQYELLFSYAVDNFKNYLSDLILEILASDPRPIFGRKLDIKYAFELEDIISLRRDAIERFVHELSYSSVADLIEFLRQNFGLSTLSNWLTIIRLNRLNQIRNLLIHNRGMVNHVYLTRSKSRRDRLGKKVFVPFPIRAAVYLDGLVNALDEEAKQKFRLESSAADYPPP